MTIDKSLSKLLSIWANRRVRVHFGNAIRDGQRIYASNGDFGAAPFAAIDITTGDTVWCDRSVSRSTIVGVSRSQGMLLVLLDEDGTLALATPGDAGLVVHARTGTTLYLRDLKQIVALDLGRR